MYLLIFSAEMSKLLVAHVAKIAKSTDFQKRELEQFKGWPLKLLEAQIKA